MASEGAFMPRQPDIRAAFIAAIQQNQKVSCLHTDKFIAELQERHWHFSQEMQIHGSSDTSRTSRIRRQTEATTVTGSCVTWGGFSNGLSFAGYGLR
jgi:hypothetical protein